LTVAETPVYNKRNTFEALCLLSRLKSAREFKLMASECTRFEFDPKKEKEKIKKKPPLNTTGFEFIFDVEKRFAAERH
jgi:hypothetical protein